MEAVVLVVHLLIAAALVGVVLLQRSEGGALGMGGGPSGFMSGRGTANLLTRTTAGLAAAFFVTSITLTLLAKKTGAPVSPFDAPIQRPAGAPKSGSAPAAPAGGTGGGLLDSLEKGRAPLPKQ